MDPIQFSDFEQVEMRIGTIIGVQEHAKARNAAYKVRIDLGVYGIKESSAQITDLYSPTDLIGKQVIVVCNFPDKQIADFMSECLILGIVGGKEGVVLLTAERVVENGQRVG